MKIIDIRAVQPETPGSPPDWRTWLGQILVRVETDDGLSGYGVGGGGLAGIHVVETALSHLLLGQDATEVEGLWQQIYRLAESYNVKVCPHRGCEVWSLHAIAALNADPLAESGRPWMIWVQGQPEIHQGDIQLGNTPGFGVTFDAQLWP